MQNRQNKNNFGNAAVQLYIAHCRAISSNLLHSASQAEHNDPLFVHLGAGRIRLFARGTEAVAIERLTVQVVLLKQAINVQ